MAGAALLSAATTSRPPVTFSKDVAPILQKNCQTCHRPGEAAPMALLTYAQARPWAKAIRQAVLKRSMPPWHADPHYGKFRNDRSLSQDEIDKVVAWVDSGAPEGDPKDLPAPAQFEEGWRIGKPDVEIAMAQPFHVQATGVMDYEHFVVPTHFTEDRWVQVAEIRPGNRAIVHHVIAFVQPPGSNPSHEPVEYLAGYAPGAVPLELEPGRAKLVSAGSNIVFELHYTPNGTAGTDQTKIGLIFAKEPPKERVYTVVLNAYHFAIPPGDPDYKVETDLVFGADVKILSLMPHMHFRGKDYDISLISPEGRSEKLLSVPHFSFAWQTMYYPTDDITAPKGSKIHCSGHFDNSVNNIYNPNPAETVRWGEQTFHEMFGEITDVAVPVGTDVRKIVAWQEAKPANWTKKAEPEP
ncbi:MAG: cytochrome c [Acidobacteriia bacterium]|nr:cytochrome c [Terriglobia bacterium]